MTQLRVQKCRNTERCETRVRRASTKRRLTLSSDAAVAQDTDSLTDIVCCGYLFASVLPLSFLLLLVQVDVLVIVNEICHDDPFGYLGAVNTVCTAERNLGVGVDG